MLQNWLLYFNSMPRNKVLKTIGAFLAVGSVFFCLGSSNTCGRISLLGFVGNEPDRKVSLVSILRSETSDLLWILWCTGKQQITQLLHVE